MPKSTGYNWRDTLPHFSRTSGVFAGFCVTFIALILGGKIADSIFIYTVTFGQLAILFFGIASGLFICAAELFLRAKEYDIYSIPEPYIDLLKEDREEKRINWKEFEDEQTTQCRNYEGLGRKCYNCAIFIIFVGLFLTIMSYNLIIAITVSGFGIILELWQIKK